MSHSVIEAPPDAMPPVARRLTDDGPLGDLAPEPEDTVRLIDPAGARAGSSPYEARVSDVDDEALVGLWEDMSAVRRIDATATLLQRQGQLALWPPLLGQEAAQIGSARALAIGDFAFTSYREHAVAHCRGVPVLDLLRVWRGVGASGWDPHAYGMATPQVIIGAQTLHAVGYAMGVSFDGGHDVAISYFGDGATSEGDVSEAMVFAATYTAPAVFFCQNNQWAISEPVALQTHTSLAGRARGFGIPAVTVDGNDVLAVLAVTREALARARDGGGPTFIEALTYRMGPHTTADDPTRYRQPAELEAWAKRDPIARLEAYLDARGALGDEVRAGVAERVAALDAQMRDGVTTLADPDPLAAFDHVYAEPHAVMDAQRAQHARYLEAFADHEATAATDQQGAGR